MNRGPRRIVCLTAETVDLLYRLGIGDRVVGVSGYSVFPPEARKKPFVSAFTTIRYKVIESLNPDLILGFSDLQAEAAKELGKRGYTVLLTNQRTLSEAFETFLMIGRIVGKERKAESLVAEMGGRLNSARVASRRWNLRPKVYFEEWDDPLITGIPWISDLIAAAGGEEAFPEFRDCRAATERVVQPQTVIERAPDIIIASWCGKKANLETIRSRPGWEEIPAVRTNQVLEIKSTYCLQPGPALIFEGLPRFCATIQNWHKVIEKKRDTLPTPEGQ